MFRGQLHEFVFWCILATVGLLVTVPGVGTYTCHEVQTAFQMRQIGPWKLVPETPETDVDLQVCKHQGPTCCTRKMEESYQAAVRRDISQHIRSYTLDPMLLLIRHGTNLQDILESLISFSIGFTGSLFDRSLADVQPLISQLFGNLSLYVLGGNVTVDSAVQHFYDNLFPFVYLRMLTQGPELPEGEWTQCLRATRRMVEPFGPYPEELVKELSGSLLAGRAMKRAMAEGAEVLTTTEKMLLSRDCERALLRMMYCPHCRGLTLIQPCEGYCLNVLRGCLADVSELDDPWRRYLTVLKVLSGAMAGDHDLELALLGVRKQIREAILHANLHASNISAAVEMMCGQPKETATGEYSSPETSTSPSLSTPLPSSWPTNETEPFVSQLSTLLRDFSRRVQRYKTIFSTLPEVLCQEVAAVDAFSCWNGADVVDSYTGHVVGNGLQAQKLNPEVKVRHADPTLAEAKTKLENFIQEVWDTTPGLYSVWSWAELSSGGTEGSAECDDEDGCQGSGEGASKNPENEKTDTSQDGVYDGKKVLPKTPPTVHPRKDRPRNTGCTLATSLTLLATTSFLLGLQWYLM
ncbi:glypican-5-like isoform X2 [Brienomyrus brachyistius]|uniref:glypican-5-like isoform X2 n=1 Tax=Brienomyrus brachyistius TaxID=42636 RepID=UPI0020B3100F|nr:glypican-5-like isoform X2 [Brienomyrus brachyistius]